MNNLETAYMALNKIHDDLMEKRKEMQTHSPFPECSSAALENEIMSDKIFAAMRVVAQLIKEERKK